MPLRTTASKQEVINEQQLPFNSLFTSLNRPSYSLHHVISEGRRQDVRHRRGGAGDCGDRGSGRGSASQRQRASHPRRSFPFLLQQVPHGTHAQCTLGFITALNYAVNEVDVMNLTSRLRLCLLRSRTTCPIRPPAGGARTAWNSTPPPPASARGARFSRSSSVRHRLIENLICA
jgi:hypothetical protein